MKRTMRCADGPYVGQTLEVPWHSLRVHWGPAPGQSFEPWPTAELVWIINGTDKHCYQPVENTNYGNWHLRYRDTF